jgi:hypothetical protein
MTGQWRESRLRRDDVTPCLVRTVTPGIEGQTIGQVGDDVTPCLVRTVTPGIEAEPAGTRRRCCVLSGRHGHPGIEARTMGRGADVAPWLRRP